MRITVTLLPLFLAAAPAAAQTPAPVAPQPPPTAEIQRALNDPAMADKMANVMQALSNAFLNLPVGEVQAAVEGRRATPAERKLTVRDLGRRDDPNFERNFRQQMAQSGPMIRQSMRAMGEALPGMMKGFEDAQKSVERAMANMPDPTYPKR